MISRIFQRLTAACGIFNSLSQTLLKITSPGIPDFYQGNELWDFSLVDPDNRRPVDYRIRKNLLDELMRMESTAGPLETAREVVATRNDGRIKLHLTCKALNFRRENRELFESGSYLPLTVEGACQEHVCAFERSVNGSSVLVVVPRFCSRLIRRQRRPAAGAGGLAGYPDHSIVRYCCKLLSQHFYGEVLNLEQQEGQLSLALAGHPLGISGGPAGTARQFRNRG